MFNFYLDKSNEKNYDNQRLDLGRPRLPPLRLTVAALSAAFNLMASALRAGRPLQSLKIEYR